MCLNLGNIYGRLDLALLIPEGRRKSLTVHFTPFKIESLLSSDCSFTQPSVLEARPSLQNIRLKTQKRTGHVIEYTINKIEFSKKVILC